MKHGYQVTTGMLKPVGGDSKMFTHSGDLTHEVESYRRQYVLTGTYPQSNQYPVIYNKWQINTLYIPTIYYIDKFGKQVFLYRR